MMVLMMTIIVATQALYCGSASEQRPSLVAGVNVVTFK